MGMTGKLGAILVLIFAIYIASPVIFRHTPAIQRFLLFMNYINYPSSRDLTRPDSYGIKCSRTLRIVNDKKENMELGAWHILPLSSLSYCVTNHDSNRTYIDDKHAFSSDSRPIILYNHGNGGNRGGNHRTRLYKRLAHEYNFHIVTFDYRGYGDSSFEYPNAPNLREDSRFVYDWLIKQPNVTPDRIVVWGHSLGTAVATALVAGLPDSEKPRGLLLESPFDSLANAIANHPFSAPFKAIPYFDYFFVDPIEKSTEFNFNSMERIVEIKTTPIMILHAEDDAIIPVHLGKNLYETALGKLDRAKVTYVQISEKYGLGHKDICDHDETMMTAKNFVLNSVDSKWA